MKAKTHPTKKTIKPSNLYKDICRHKNDLCLETKDVWYDVGSYAEVSIQHLMYTDHPAMRAQLCLFIDCGCFGTIG